MSELQRVAKLKFPDGELDEFKLRSTKCMA
jgi:hypothetical protein